MAEREMGLMGYVGESVVEQWLEFKYPAEQGHRIIRQVKPEDIRATGGPYSDFGVIRDGRLIALYEVKSQDYITDKEFKLNAPIARIWSGEETSVLFKSQEGETFQGGADTEAYLVLLVGPNEGAIENLGRKNLGRVVLFSDVWHELHDGVSEDRIMNEMREDLLKVLYILRNPTQGKEITPAFIRLRAKLRDNPTG